MYLLQLYLATSHLRTRLTNKKWKPCHDAHVQQFQDSIKWTERLLGLTPEAKSISSKQLIQVHLENLSCSVEKMASHLLTKYITWRKGYQFLRSLKSWNRCTCTSCTWLPFHIGQVCSQEWCRPYLAANFGLFELQTFPWSSSTVEVGKFYDSQRISRTTKHISKAGKVDPGDRLTLPVKFACKPELTLTRLLG